MIRTIFILLTSSVVSSFLTLITQILIAKNIQPEEFGEFSSLLSSVMLLAPLVAMGADGYLLKYYAEMKKDLSGFNVHWFVYFILTSFCSILIFISLNNAVYLFSLLIISQSLLNMAVASFQVKSKFQSVSLILMLQSSLRFILIFGIYTFDKVNISNVYYSYIFVSFIVLFVSFIYIYINNFRTAFCINMQGVKFNLSGQYLFLKNSMPYGLTTLLHLIYFQSDVIIIEKFYSTREAGLYSVSFVLLAASYLIPSVIYQKYLLPKIHLLSYDNLNASDEEYILFKKGAFAMFILGLIFFGFYYFFSGFLIKIFYGDLYKESESILSLLSFCIFFRYLSSNAGVFLMTKNLIHKKNKYMFFCALFNLVLNIVFIPYYGGFAAAITTIMTEILLCSLFYYGIHKYKFRLNV